MIEKREFYINGAWVSPVDGKLHQVINPATEEACATISLGGVQDTDAAVAAAKAAFEDWMMTDPAERLELIQKLLDVYTARAEEMAEAISMEMGAPIDLSRQQQVTTGLSHIKTFIRTAKDFQYTRPLSDRSPDNAILYEPVGVVGMITPWNWPMNQITLKAVPAMAVGCTMILKPSEESPLSGTLFAEMVDEAGFPKGVFNLVNGDGMGVGTRLSTHPDVDMISFTGSTRAGIAITKAAADTIKRVSLELGGKGANIIFADADEKAVKRGVLRVMNNSGQSCNAPTRMLVERSIYDKAVEIAAETADSIKVGVPNEEGGHMGPVVNEAQFNKIQSMIQQGIDEGARLVAGGVGRPEGLNRGFYVRPTVFADADNEMVISRQEIFGPVMCMMPFEDEEDAVRIANDTVYGLTNFVQSGDEAKRQRVARRLRAGMVEMNGKPRGAGAPFGGYKQSGNGREGGHWGLEDFLEVKSTSGFYDT